MEGDRRKGGKRREEEEEEAGRSRSLRPLDQVISSPSLE